MSQGDLAEKLDVSRQSVSKWETGASIPELDKLIMMSKLFNVTLDELVGSDVIPENAANNTEQPKNYVFTDKQRDLRQTVGFILLGTGLLACVLGLALSPPALAFGLCLTVYGVICLAVKKHIGIVCVWVSAVILIVLAFISNLQ